MWLGRLWSEIPDEPDAATDTQETVGVSSGRQSGKRSGMAFSTAS